MGLVEVDVPVQLVKKDVRAFTIADDAMMDDDPEYDVFRPDDIVVFQDRQIDKFQFVVAAKAPPDDRIVVRVLLRENGKRILRAIRPNEPDIEEPFTVIGIAIGYTRNDGQGRLTYEAPSGIKPKMKPRDEKG